MHTQRVGGFRQTSLSAAENADDESLLEFVHGVVELDATLDHFFDQLLQAFADHWSSFPVRRRNASTYFSRVLTTTSSGSDGTGGCLFHRICSR